MMTVTDSASRSEPKKRWPIQAVTARPMAKAKKKKSLLMENPLPRCGRPQVIPVLAPAEHPVQRVKDSALLRSNGGANHPAQCRFLGRDQRLFVLRETAREIAAPILWKYERNTGWCTRSLPGRRLNPALPAWPGSGCDPSSLFGFCREAAGLRRPLCVAG